MVTIHNHFKELVITIYKLVYLKILCVFYQIVSVYIALQIVEAIFINSAIGKYPEKKYQYFVGMYLFSKRHHSGVNNRTRYTGRSASVVLYTLQVSVKAGCIGNFHNSGAVRKQCGNKHPIPI